MTPLCSRRSQYGLVHNPGESLQYLCFSLYHDNKVQIDLQDFPEIVQREMEEKIIAHTRWPALLKT